MLNRTDLAAPLGISVPTADQWLSILEITGQIIRVPPYFENLGKRLIKSPKVYITDSGMACHLLGIRTQSELDRSPFLGPLFEGLVASEILKSQINRGRRRELYYFRDQQGLEVDFLFPYGTSLWMLECQASKTIQPAMAAPLQALRRAMGERAQVRASIVHRPTRTGPASRGVAPGVEALDVNGLVAELNA
jgi:predicted AAA+ superfamily ATPase